MIPNAVQPPSSIRQSFEVGFVPALSTQAMGIKERHERERESVRHAILAAARDLFVAEGYERVSMRKIAERIEYSPAAIYGYFPSKADIFFALAEEGFRLLHDKACAAPACDDPVETLRQRLWAFYRFSREHPEHFALMFADRTVPRIRAHYQQFHFLVEMKRSCAALIERCAQAGAFPGPLDPEGAFRVMVTAISGVGMAALCNRLGPGEDPDRLAHDVIELLIGGLRAGVPVTFTPCVVPGCDEAAGAAAPALQGTEASAMAGACHVAGEAEARAAARPPGAAPPPRPA
jgi:AcrR family transcriptional regulator